MTSPPVSVIIPTYNRAPLVVRAAASALDQTYPSMDVIVVDDGSSDDTEQRLAAELGSQIRYLRQDNQGVSAARNRGLREATGDYIAFLDSDDVWLPKKITAQVDFLRERPKYGMVVCDYYDVDRSGTVVSIERRRQQYGADGHVLKRILNAPNLVPSTALLRREVYEEVGGFDTSLKTAEDIDFHLRVAKRFPIGVIEEPLVRYLSGNDSLSEDVSSYRDYVRVIRRFVKANHDVLSRREIHDAIFSARLKLARGLMWDGDLFNALATGARCLPYITRPKQGLELSVLSLRTVAYSILRGIGARG